MRASPRIATSATGVARASRRIGILTECEGQQVVDESVLPASGLSVDEKRQAQPIVTHRRTSHAFGSRLPDAEEPRRASVDHAVEYRFGADSSSPRG